MYSIWSGLHLTLTLDHCSVISTLFKITFSGSGMNVENVHSSGHSPVSPIATHILCIPFSIVSSPALTVLLGPHQDLWFCEYSRRELSFSYIYFLILGPNYICAIGEARHFKFRMLIDTEEFQCRHDRLTSKGMCSRSRVLFRLLKYM